MVLHRRGSLDTISDTASPAPRRLQSLRNGRSVTPAIGATINGLANLCGPICIATCNRQLRKPRREQREVSPRRSGLRAQLLDREQARTPNLDLKRFRRTIDVPHLKAAAKRAQF